MSDLAERMSWMGMAKTYAQYSTDAPIEFTEVMTLQDIGFALGPDIVHRIQPDEIYHNVYSAFVGPSTKSRKDTVQRLMGENIVPQEYHLPKAGSPEAFLEELSEHNSGFLFAGEWSEELKGIKSGNYKSTFAEIKNNLSRAGRPYRKRLTSKGGKKVEYMIDDPYLCINTTITPEVLKENLTTEIANGGYVARHILASGPIKPRKRGRLKKEAKQLKRLLQSTFKFVHGLDKTNCVFMLSDEALKYYNDVVEEEAQSNEFECVSSSAGRYLDYVIVFADCLLVSEAIGIVNSDYDKDYRQISKLVELVNLVKFVENISEYNPNNWKNPTNPTNSLIGENGEHILVVQKRHVEEAWRILKKCLCTVREIVEYVDMGKPLARVRNIMMKNKKDGIEHSAALRASNLDAKQFSDAIDTLIERNEVRQKVEEIWRKNNTKGHKRSYVWIGRKE
jgi:hypothetical protein